MWGCSTLSDEGISQKELIAIYHACVEAKYKVEFYDLKQSLPPELQATYPEASLLIIRNGVNVLTSDPEMADKLLKEQGALIYDSKAKMRGRVVNKHARHNLCFSDVSQEPDYEVGKGRIIDFKSLPNLSKLGQSLSYLGKKTTNLQAEGNFYYDVKKCYSDSERRVVVAARLGASFSLYYQWYYQTKEVGSRIALNLDHGDLYIMSDKAVGHDWKRKIIPTLRHAAGVAALSKD